MSDLKKVLLIGRTISNILQDIKEGGFDIYLITREQDLIYDSNLSKITEEITLLDYQNEASLISKCIELHNRIHFDCVFAFSEEGLYPAALIAEVLKLPGLKRRSVEFTRDKFLMRKLLNSNPNINTQYSMVETIEDIKSFFYENGKCILKPIDGFGSEGVITINSTDEIESAFEFSNTISKSKKLLIEKFIEGRSLSIETFSFNKQHEILTITDRSICNPPYCVSTSLHTPASLTKNELISIRETISSLLDIVEYEFGPAHIEINLSEDNAKVIEIQTRPGGRVHEMLKYGLGINIFSMTLRKLLNLSYIPQEGPGAAAIVYFASNNSGIVESIEIPMEVKNDSRTKDFVIRIKEGSEVFALQRTKHRFGHILCVGSDAEETLNYAYGILNKCNISVK